MREPFFEARRNHRDENGDAVRDDCPSCPADLTVEAHASGCPCRSLEDAEIEALASAYDDGVEIVDLLQEITRPRHGLSSPASSVRRWAHSTIGGAA